MINYDYKNLFILNPRFFEECFYKNVIRNMKFSMEILLRNVYEEPFLDGFHWKFACNFFVIQKVIDILKNILISKIGIIVDILKSKCFFFHYWNMQIFEGYSYENIVKNMKFFIKILVENVSNKSIFWWILLGIYV